jgi:hypothetical protein
MFGARGLLLIFIALGTNGQLLTEKIPLGEVFCSLWKFMKNEEEKKIFVMSCWAFFTVEKRFES